jgi:hypothetical protein
MIPEKYISKQTTKEVNRKEEEGKLGDLVEFSTRQDKYIPNSKILEVIDELHKLSSSLELEDGKSKLLEALYLTDTMLMVADGRIAEESSAGNGYMSKEQISLRDIQRNYLKKREELQSTMEGLFGYTDKDSANIT